MSTADSTSETRIWTLRGTFPRLWVGDAFTRAGYQIALFLLPLLVVTRLHGSGIQVGLVSASQFVPVVLFALPAGIFADRLDNRLLILSSTAVRAIALALLGVMYALVGAQVWPVVLAAFVVGSGSVFYDVGFQSFIPKLLRPHQLAEGNGLLRASFSATEMLGPAAAGTVLQFAGPELAVAIILGLFAFALLIFLTMRGRGGSPTPTVSVPVGRRSVLAGFRFTLTCRPVRDLCIQSGLFNVHQEAFVTAFLIYGVRTAMLSSGAVGGVLAVASVGALLGSIGIGRASGRVHAGGAVTLGIVSSSVVLLTAVLIAPSLPTFVVFAVAFFVNGLGLGVYNVYAVSLRQAVAPADFLGSVNASYRLVSFGAIPLGTFVGGSLAEFLGGTDALLAIGTSMAVCSVHLVLSPVRRIRRVHDALEEERSLVPEWTSGSAEG